MADLNDQIDAAFAKAEETAKQAVPKAAQTPETPWWEAAVGVAGLLGLIGLIGFAVAAARADDEKPKEPAAGPASAARQRADAAR